MKVIKVLGFFLLIFGSHVEAYKVYAKSSIGHPMVVDFLSVTGNSNATLSLAPASAEKLTSDERDIGGCTAKVRVTIIKPNGGYGGSVSATTPGRSCHSFDVNIDTEQNQLRVTVINRDANWFIGGEEPKIETDDLASLLSATTENSIITNKTNAQIFLFNAPSLGSGASEGVPVNSGATIPFYLNASSAGEELVIKGKGAGIVSFGNDYAKHKTTWIGSTNISKFVVIDGNGAATNKKLDAQAHLVIDPVERVDITTPLQDWEIRLKVAEEIK